MRMYADPTRTWAAPHPTQKGFVLHDTQEPRYLNGDHSLCNNQMSHPGPTSVFPTSSSLFNQTQATSASPQHRNTVSVFHDFIFRWSLLRSLYALIDEIDLPPESTRISYFYYGAVLSYSLYSVRHNSIYIYTKYLFCIQCTHARDCISLLRKTERRARPNAAPTAAIIVWVKSYS